MEESAMSRKCAFVLVGLVLSTSIAASPPEPNADLAATWWPAQRNVWTPVGWKDHLFRFSVLYNGTVSALPHVRRSKKHTEPYAGQGVLLTMTPSADGTIPEPVHTQPYLLANTVDRGIGRQGWCDGATPRIWTEWRRREGVVLREEVFAHLAGGGVVKTGIEPLYAWIRLSVMHVDEFKAPETFSIVVGLEANHIKRKMRPQLNLLALPDRSPYYRPLNAEHFSIDGGQGCRVTEANGKIRLIGISTDGGAFQFSEREPDSRRYHLCVTLPANRGAHADLLVPMIPGKAAEVETKLSLGFEKALVESDMFWSRTPATAAHIDTPEKQVNEAIKHNIKLAEIISETNPGTGEQSYLTGSWHYDVLWTTPTSMTSHMMMDPLGYHESVEKHIEIYRRHQGEIKPPGPGYRKHPGYFCSPKNLSSIDWLSDHGAVLHLVARHALLTGDPDFINRWTEPVVKACEFIGEARAIEGHDGVAGVLPPAVATDRGIPTQSVWNIGWNYRGLTTAVRLLRRIGHPRADEFATEAREYREVFVKAFRERAGQMVRWTDTCGMSRAVVPMSLSAGADIHHAFYLDTGPIFLVWAGLMNANDELMRSAIAYLREGPNTRLFDSRSGCWQRPVLVHEISSCEPCYSWNIYHSWQLGDRYRFLEGMYSLLAGAISSQTYVSCETRHGIYGTVFACVLLTDLVRLSVIDDTISEDELHLLRLVPKAWLKADRATRFENMPTEFGPVSVRFQLADSSKTLKVNFAPRWRHRPGRVLLHVPPIKGLKQVVVNGQQMETGPGQVLSIR
jgi:hypothetical protein